MSASQYGFRSQMTRVGGKLIPCPNSVLDAGMFYVSVNYRDSAIYGDVTTALVVGQMQSFYILNGDHARQYAELVPQGFDACMNYFLANSDKISRFSRKPTERPSC
jgi:hypothetical protein